MLSEDDVPARVSCQKHREADMKTLSSADSGRRAFPLAHGMVLRCTFQYVAKSELSNHAVAHFLTGLRLACLNPATSVAEDVAGLTLLSHKALSRPDYFPRLPQLKDLGPQRPDQTKHFASAPRQPLYKPNKPDWRLCGSTLQCRMISAFGKPTITTIVAFPAGK